MREKSQERPGERLGIETDRPVVHYDPEHQTNAEEPHAAYRQEKPQGPASMQIEPARASVSPGRDCEGQDEQRIEADRDVLRQIADHATAAPHHDQAADAHGRGQKQVGSTVPAMEGWSTAANLRHQLQGAANEDRHGEQQM